MNAKVILYHQKTLANGEFPLMLRITDGSLLKYKSIGISLPASAYTWDTKTIQSGKHKGELKKVPKQLKAVRDKHSQEHTDFINLRALISDIESKYNNVIKSLAKEGRTVTIDQLINIVTKPVKKTTVFSYWMDRIGYWKGKGRIGNFEAYTTALNRFKVFREDTDLKFYDMDKNLLKKYRDWMEASGIKDTSISVYLRTLRAVWYAAVEDGFAKKDPFPFGTGDKSVFHELKLKTIKRAIRGDAVRRFASIKKVPAELQAAHNYFMFGIYFGGINFADMALLKWSDIEDGRVIYNRKKTGVKVDLQLIPQAKAIIEQYRPLTGIDKNNYIFPVLNRHIHKTPTQIKNRTRKVIAQVNKSLKALAVKAKIETNLTTYVWRHSFATVARDLGLPVEYIKEAMGQSDLKVTQIYLANLPNEIKDSYHADFANKISGAI